MLLIITGKGVHKKIKMSKTQTLNFSMERLKTQ